MKGPAIIPWLRKKEWITVLSGATMVRTRSTPATRKLSQIASNSREPRPCTRCRDRTCTAKTQPLGEEPNSQARTSPMMKPSMRPARSATRKTRESSGRAP